VRIYHPSLQAATCRIDARIVLDISEKAEKNAAIAMFYLVEET